MSERGVSIRRESAWDRVKALQDIVPPSTRRWFGQKFNTTTSYAFFGGKLVGNLVWIATTSALLVGLPYALASEEEAMLVKQEREFAQQQSGAQQVSRNRRWFVLTQQTIPDDSFLPSPPPADARWTTPTRRPRATAGRSAPTGLLNAKAAAAAVLQQHLHSRKVSAISSLVLLYFFPTGSAPTIQLYNAQQDMQRARGRGTERRVGGCIL